MNVVHLCLSCTQEQNKAGPSFSKTLLENTDQHRLSMDEMSYLAGTLFGAGSDTASHAIHLVLLKLLTFSLDCFRCYQYSSVRGMQPTGSGKSA